MIDDQELKTHFGKTWQYEHAVNLRDRMPENKNHLTRSMEWAVTELGFIKALVVHLEHNGEAHGDAGHFKRQGEILVELIGADMVP